MCQWLWFFGQLLIRRQDCWRVSSLISSRTVGGIRNHGMTGGIRDGIRDGIYRMVGGKPPRCQKILQSRQKRGGWFSLPISRGQSTGCRDERPDGAGLKPSGPWGNELLGVAPGWDGAARWALGGRILGRRVVLAGALGKRVRTIVTHSRGLWRGVWGGWSTSLGFCFGSEKRAGRLVPPVP